MKHILTSTVHFAGVTHRGCVRGSNEDCMLLFDRVFYDNSELWIDSQESFSKGWICAVADGIGGARAGEIASQYALRKLSKVRDITPSHIATVLVHLNNELIKLGNEKPALKGLGTTVAGIGFNKDDTLFAFNVGDARVYRIVNNKLKQLTIDDNLAAVLKEEGRKIPTKEMLLYASALTQSIGGSEFLNEIQPHLFIVKPKKTERFLLCTDGLNSMVEHCEMEKIIISLSSPKEVAKALLKRAIEAGGRDNITIIYLEINFS
ncbi:MAG: PP2C family protein-serine/threonine phosphatase [Verrucomicrobiia bacterium]